LFQLRLEWHFRRIASICYVGRCHHCAYGCLVPLASKHSSIKLRSKAF
jgi:hypothetical protein